MVSLSNLKSLLEIAGGFAVLVGLVFVGFELRRNTAALQAATIQDLTHAPSHFLVNIGSNPDVYRIYSKGRLDPGAFSLEERGRYYFLQQAFWLRMQNAYTPWQRGALVDDDWAVYRAVACASATAPGPESHWRSEGSIGPAFRAFLESCDAK